MVQTTPLIQTPVAAQSPTPNQQSEAAKLSETQAPQTANDEPSPLAVAKAPVSGKPDLWTRIRNGFALNEIDSPLVKDHENWYARRPDYVGRMMARSQLYLFH